MATYHVQLPDGSEYNIDAENDAQAHEAVNHLTKAPQWEDIPDNVAKGIAEAPQTALGAANAAVTGMNLTSPIALAQSAGEALAGAPLGETETGQAVKDTMAGVKDTAAKIPGIIQHPLDWAKNQIIEHPIGTAAMLLPGMEGATGAVETAGKYAGRFGENQALKSLGARSGQIGDLGIPESRAIGREMVERGIIKPFRGPINLEEKVQSLHDEAGHNIGGARAVADARSEAAGESSAPSKDALLKSAQEKFGPSYESGHLAPRIGTFKRVLETVENPVIEDGHMTPQQAGNFQGNAAKATELNSAGTPDKRLSQSEDSPFSDVANMISRQNNEAMGKVLTPDEASTYKQSLKDYSTMDKVRKFMESGEKRETTSRGGASIGKTLYDKTMDSFGNRASAVGGIKGGNFLQGLSKNAKGVGAAGVTSSIMNALTKNPSALGKYAKPLSQAAQSGGQQGIAAMHFVLSQNDPQYNAMWQKGGAQSDPQGNTPQ